MRVEKEKIKETCNGDEKRMVATAVASESSTLFM